MGRGISRSRVGLSAAALVLGSCTALGFGGPYATSSLVTTLSPDIAAWLAAEACRAEHPGADPLPLHPGSPVLRHADDHYEIRYNRAPPQGYRVFTNGRLVPSKPTAIREGGQALALAQVSFHAAPRATGHRAPGPDEARIRITAAPLGSRVSAELSGAVAGGTLVQHLHRVFALAEAIQETAIMVEEKRWAMARERVDQALSEFGPGCCGRHQALRTRLLIHVATAAQAQGHLSAARAATARALGLAPDIPGLRLWQADLDQRLALDREAATDWHILAASPAGDGFCHAAAGELRDSLDRLLQLAPGMRYRERATALLRENDVAGARSQLDMARSVDPLPRTDLRGLTLWHKRQGRHRAAFEVALQRLELHTDPALILEMSELCAHTDQSILGLRLLAKHWDALLRHDRAGAEAWLRFHSRRIGAEMATRVLTAEGAVSLAQERLALWIHSGRADPAEVDILAMVWWLRTEGQTELRDWEGVRTRDYQSAPGVRPR